MKNTKLIIFILILTGYIVGLVFGCVGQVNDKNQAGMYDYLETSVSEYELKIKDSIEGVATDNFKLVILLLVGGVLKFSPIIIFAVSLLKGYSMGFALMAMMRLFGIKGLFFCGGNFLSAVFLIPSLAIFGALSYDNRRYNFMEKKIFYKKYFFLGIFIIAIFGIDSIARGFLSAIFMKFASGILSA